MSDYLSRLEAEAIHVLRETAGQFERPALLFSGGKDSICLVHLALKAFRPGKLPFPLVHIDTGHNFPEALQFRDQLAEKLGEQLIVRRVEDTLKRRGIPDAKGKFPSRNPLQTHTLLETIEEFGFGQPSFDEELLTNGRHDGHYFPMDSKLVYYAIKKLVLNSTAYSCIIKWEKKFDGRSAYKALERNYLGPHVTHLIQRTAERLSTLLSSLVPPGT